MSTEQTPEDVVGWAPFEPESTDHGGRWGSKKLPAKPLSREAFAKEVSRQIGRGKVDTPGGVLTIRPAPPARLGPSCPLCGRARLRDLPLADHLVWCVGCGWRGPMSARGERLARVPAHDRGGLYLCDEQATAAHVEALKATGRA